MKTIKNVQYKKFLIKKIIFFNNFTKIWAGIAGKTLAQFQPYLANCHAWVCSEIQVVQQFAFHLRINKIKKFLICPNIFCCTTYSFSDKYLYL